MNMILKIKNLWQKYRKEILISLIVTAITSFVWAIATRIADMAPSLSKTFLSTLINAIYRTAATCEYNKISEMTFALLFGGFLGCVSAFAFKMTRIINRKAPPLKVAQEKDESEKTTQNAKREGEKTKKEKREPVKRLIFLLWAWLALFTFFMVAFVVVPNDLYKKFSRDITMIAPYVEDRQIITLKSKWVLMEQKQDYVEIYTVIDAVKAENSLPQK